MTGCQTLARVSYVGDRDFPPYEYIDDQGRPAGFNIRMIQAIAAALGTRIEIQLVPGAELRARRERGTADLFSVGYVSTRAAQFDFLGPTTTVRSSLLMLSGRATYPAGDTGYQGLRIAIQEGTPSLAAFNTLPADERPLIVPTASHRASIALVAGGQVDAAAGAGATLRWHAARAGLTIPVEIPMSSSARPGFSKPQPSTPISASSSVSSGAAATTSWRSSTMSLISRRSNPGGSSWTNTPSTCGCSCGARSAWWSTARVRRVSASRPPSIQECRPGCQRTMIGGSIEVHSVHNEGSTFTLCVTVARAAAPTSTAATAPRTVRTTPSLRVILAEDNPVNQLVQRRLLAHLGYTCDVAGNGLELLDRVAKAEYDVVFLDMQMPEMDGLEAARQLRLRGHTDLFLVALTADVTTETRAACAAAGIHEYLSKPVTVDKLSEVLIRAESLRPMRKAAAATG